MGGRRAAARGLLRALRSSSGSGNRSGGAAPPVPWHPQLQPPCSGRALHSAAAAALTPARGGPLPEWRGVPLAGCMVRGAGTGSGPLQRTFCSSSSSGGGGGGVSAPALSWRSQQQQQPPGDGRALHAAAAARAPALGGPLPDLIRLPNGDTLHKPTEPDPDECCGRGCAECVWTLYTQDLHDYQAAVARARGCKVPEDPFEALERRLAAQTAQLQDADGQGQ